MASVSDRTAPGAVQRAALAEFAAAGDSETMITKRFTKSVYRREVALGGGALALAGLVPKLGLAQGCLFPEPATLVYAVRWDGVEVGRQTFAFVRDKGAFVVLKTVRAERRRQGYPVARFEQRVQEVWVDGWLHALTARTERDGTATTLEGARRDRGLSLTRGDGARFNIAGYILADTLWNRDTPHERGLLDVETGHIRLMRGYPRGRERVPGFGGGTRARHYLVRGQVGFEVWYDDACRLVRAAYTRPDGIGVEVAAAGPD